MFQELPQVRIFRSGTYEIFKSIGGVMKERPILFSTEMVKAILDGRKTMTRRVVKPQPIYNEAFYGGWGICTKKSDTAIKSFNEGCYKDLCPYGQVGDRLWVRETFWQDERDKMICFEADKTYKVHPDTNYLLQRKYNGTANPDMLQIETNIFWHKRPSIFMPRWASRITLEITNIKVERLQEITYDDAFKEGKAIMEYSILMHNPIEDLFRTLWNSINAKRGYSWESNPWVWVIEFKRI